MRNGSESGFSLIELMVVVTIMAILAVVVISKFRGMDDEARVITARSQIMQIADALEYYKLKHKSYPSTAEGLEVLTEGGEGNTGWTVDSIVDPWGNEYIYEYDPAGNTFDIISYGADGAPGGTGYNADIKYSERKEWQKK